MRVAFALSRCPEHVRASGTSTGRFVVAGRATSSAGAKSPRSPTRRADAAMNEMSPGDDDGQRTGPAEIYEVVLDDSY